MARMSLWTRLLGINTRAAAGEPSEPSEVPHKQIWPPPSRLRDGTDLDPTTLIPIYRGLQVLSGSAGQLSLDVERQGRIVTERIPAIVRRPDPDLDRSEWLEQATLELAVDGNLFTRKLTGPDGSIIGARIIPARDVTVSRHPRTLRPLYHLATGETLTTADVDHQAMLRRAGQLRGRGPIAAAREDLDGIADINTYAHSWFRGTGQPSGILSTTSSKTADEAKAIRDRWNEAQLDPDNISGIRVIGGDTTYTPLLLNPEDAQWISARQFGVTDCARLLGIPATLMLAAVEGTSMTYSNVEQEWLAFVRFTLLSYIRKIEEALTSISPLGQTVRANIETLLRSDTGSRYESYSTAIASRWMTPDEVRGIEGKPPLTDEQWDQLARLSPKPKEAAA